MSGFNGDGVLCETAAAQVFEQQNHLVLMVLNPFPRGGAPRSRRGRDGVAAASLELCDSIRQLPAATLPPAGHFQDAGSQEFRDVLKFVSRETL